MEKKNLLIVGILTGIIIVLIGIGPIIFPNSTSADDSISAGNLHDLNSSAKNITDGLNSVNESSTNETFPEDFSKDYTTFDNSTSKLTAISIARLYQGVSGFYTSHTFNTSLTPDKKYWIVKMDDLMVVTVNAKTLMSKQNGDLNQPANTWRSLNELKAQYIADIHSGCLSENARVGKPSKVTIDGKKIWKVPVYYYNDVDHKITEYVYVDLVTGKSKNTWNDFNELTWTKEWLTLKEMDDRSGLWPSPFKDALRNLYPE